MSANRTNRRARALMDSLPDLEISVDPDTLESHGRDWTRFRQPAPSAVAFPRNTDQVCQLVRVAARQGIPLVPSGGRTGLSGGAVADNGEVVVSFDRMRRIVDFNPIDRTVVVEPGVATRQVQDFATEHDLHYPVSFASEGSSQLGGNIATNAGGIRVLRYGLTRDQVVGLKVVDGHGEVLDCNAGLVKNASGYDLRHLFIGSEGTLGLIVEATLRLVDPPAPSQVMLLAVSGIDAMMKVFKRFNDAMALTAFEFFSNVSLKHVCRGHGLGEPMEGDSPFYALLEYECSDNGMEDAALEVFERCLDNGFVEDGVISQSDTQAAELWRYREGISEAITPYTPYKNDLSVKVSNVPDYLKALDKLVSQRYPDFEVLWYGHIGDGNLHMNILKPENMDTEAFEQACGAVNEAVFALTGEFQGSISAEHGIGLLKQPYVGYSRAKVDIQRMRGIKAVFDPQNILNPGKLLR